MKVSLVLTYFDYWNMTPRHYGLCFNSSPLFLSTTTKLQKNNSPRSHPIIEFTWSRHSKLCGLSFFFMNFLLFHDKGNLLYPFHNIINSNIISNILCILCRRCRRLLLWQQQSHNRNTKKNIE